MNESVSNSTEPLLQFPPSARNSYPQAEHLIAALERALMRVAALPLHVSPATVHLARRTLTAFQRGPFAGITERVAAHFRLRPDELQSKSREQRIAFARQVAYFLIRNLTAASFPAIAQHFGRHHASVMHGYQLIEHRIARDAAFRLFISKLEVRITNPISTTAAVAA